MDGGDDFSGFMLFFLLTISFLAGMKIGGKEAYLVGQKHYASGIVNVQQATNEVGEVEWEYKH